MVEIKRVSYAFNSDLDEPFFLDVLSKIGERTLVDFHGTFKTKEEFYQEMERLVRALTLEDVDDKKNTQRV